MVATRDVDIQRLDTMASEEEHGQERREVIPALRKDDKRNMDDLFYNV